MSSARMSVTLADTRPITAFTLCIDRDAAAFSVWQTDLHELLS